MDKYEKLFKGLEMCAGPDCNPECPYHGETRGGKTCRAWLLNDAAAALASEESLAYAYKVQMKEANKHIDAMEAESQKKPEPGLTETMDVALKATMQAEYWRGQADGMKWAMRFYYSDNETLKREISDVPEPEADDHV